MERSRRSQPGHSQNTIGGCGTSKRAMVSHSSRPSDASKASVTWPPTSGSVSVTEKVRWSPIANAPRSAEVAGPDPLSIAAAGPEQCCRPGNRARMFDRPTGPSLVSTTVTTPPLWPVRSRVRLGARSSLRRSWSASRRCSVARACLRVKAAAKAAITMAMTDRRRARRSTSLIIPRPGDTVAPIASRREGRQLWQSSARPGYTLGGNSVDHVLRRRRRGGFHVMVTTENGSARFIERLARKVREASSATSPRDPPLRRLDMPTTVISTSRATAPVRLTTVHVLPAG